MSRQVAAGKRKIEPTSKIRLELLTAFLPVENIHDDGDVVAQEVDVHLRTGVFALCCRDRRILCWARGWRSAQVQTHCQGECNLVIRYQVSRQVTRSVLYELSC